MTQTLRRILLSAGALVALAFAVVVVNQTLQLAEFAGRFHSVAGTVVLWGLVAVYALCVLVPAVLWLRLPPPLAPPQSDEGPEFERHLESLRSRLRANALISGRPLETREQIEEALGVLDERAGEILRQAASRVFLATAVSQNGSLDALVVLGIQSRLVWDVAKVYHQRPAFREMGSLYANVVVTAFVAGEIEEIDLSERIQPVLSGVLGSAAGAVPGLQAASTLFVTSVATGSANAFLTLRVGILAREYSRALTRRPRGVMRRSAAAAAAGMLGSIVVSGAARVSAAVAQASTRGVTGAFGRLGRSVRTRLGGGG